MATDHEIEVGTTLFIKKCLYSSTKQMLVLEKDNKHLTCKQNDEENQRSFVTLKILCMLPNLRRKSVVCIQSPRVIRLSGRVWDENGRILHFGTSKVLRTGQSSEKHVID